MFDEKRYFQPGEGATVVDLDGFRFGLIICEDVWLPAPCRAPAEAGAQAILVINGSPFHMTQQRLREQVLAARATENSLPLIYLNMVGGQDELVFDGGSVVVDGAGEVRFRAPLFEEGLYVVELDRAGGKLVPRDAAPQPAPPLVERVYRALVLGTRDYVEKNGFRGVVLGLSGGVDSALTLAIAVDALGPKRVHAVMMPSRFTSQMSTEDAAEQARRLACVSTRSRSSPCSRRRSRRSAACSRGCRPTRPRRTSRPAAAASCLMAISNKLGEMLLTTGNKSEMAVGYATLYGDMAGGFAPLKDCTKTLVYQLAAYRNGVEPVIPERVITRAPTAELRANQKDSDSLPPVRRARSDPRGVHREGLLGRPNRGARFRSRDGRARAADGQARRVQAPAGAARRAREQPRVRPRLALSDHLGILVRRSRACAVSGMAFGRAASGSGRGLACAARSAAPPPQVAA